MDNGKWLAQAVDEVAAMQVLNALRAMEESTVAVSAVPGVPDGQYRRVPLTLDQTQHPIKGHVRWRENDEYACSCRLRWGVDEDDPHGTT